VFLAELTSNKGVEETKRQASGTWLYRRNQPEIATAEQPSSPSKPQDGRPFIRTSRPGDEKRLLRNLVNAPPTGLLLHQAGQDVIAPAVVPPGSAALPSNSNAEPRRFHLSRFDMQQPTSESPVRGAYKRSRASALFVERSTKRKRVVPVTGEELPIRLAKPDDTAMEVEAPRVQKRPGATARTKATPQAAETKKPELPPSLRNRQEGDMDTIQREMNEFILQHINHNLATLEAEPKPKTTPIKYRPKAPVKRYAQRHPEVASPGKGGEDVDMDVDMDQTETDDEDYVVETYVRVPAHTLTVPVPTEQVGLLVFDQETDIDYFYGAGEDSSDENDEDDEDSNGKSRSPRCPMRGSSVKLTQS
jgi:hypothetical protein